ncbi:hypothetical protein D0Z07_4264 [Hyphodiscus hymeniophilus]|uniref:Uncharacterized protein n=1 Tax=Hyphodiscus hymeniophilus TaxID=353542 RepID=A0A9P6VJH2_9HELO|nr:hypothetical protein D0Z07_4264 [Hyphodiscus hymeniophilus]
MRLSLLRIFVPIFLCPFVADLVTAQSSTDSGYVGYSLDLEGDQDSVVYDTASTPANVSTTVPQPDVYLNASVSVGEIDITVKNLTAKINLDVQVLQLLTFNAGVDLSIDRVTLLIQNVSAKVLLEARLENVLMMINDTLSSIDLNPIIATLGQDVGELVNTTVGGLTGSSTNTVARRSYELINNVLYSINDYSGNTHTNRILAQNGDIVDQFLDNDGNILRQQVVGSYLQDMTFNGYNQTIIKNGMVEREVEYVYTPFNGISVVSAIYMNAEGTVLAAQVLSESSAGGSSTIGDN